MRNWWPVVRIIIPWHFSATHSQAQWQLSSRHLENWFVHTCTVCTLKVIVRNCFCPHMILTWNKKKIKTRTICSTMVHIFDNCSILYSLSLYTSLLQLTTSSRRLDGGAFCVASVGGKWIASNVIWALLEELGGRARSVQIVDCCVHTSTAGLGVTSPFDADAAVQKKEEEEEGVVD